MCRRRAGSPFFFFAGSGHPEIGGLSLLHFPGFAVTLGSQAVLAALVLLGLRRVVLAAIAASVLYWIVARHWLPDPLQMFSASVYTLEAAALIASPGPRRGRQIMTWGHGLVLLVAAAAVQASTLLYDAIGPPWGFLTTRQPGTSGYLVLSIVLAVIAVSLMVTLKMNRYVLLLLAGMFYPYALQLASSPTSTSSNLIGHPTPVHLALLFLPPLLLACWAVLRAVPPLRSRGLLPHDAGKSELT